MVTKKGQGLSLNTIIIAIIVLIVLVVLVMIFTGYFGKIFTPSVKSCATQGGACVDKCNEGSYGARIAGGDCSTAPGTTCCSKVKDIGFGVDIKDQAESCEGPQGQGGSCQTLGKKDDTSKPGCTDGDPQTLCPQIDETCSDKGSYSGQITATGCLSTQKCCK